MTSPPDSGEVDPEDQWSNGPLPASADPVPLKATTPTPLPVKRVFVICTIMLVSAMSVSLVFPFVGFMVIDFGLATEERAVGKYAGYIAASYSIGSTLTAALWGFASDRLGRRPILISGMIGTTAALLAFGYSSSYTWALVARTLHGALNGNISVCKTYVSEICDETNQARAFSLTGMMWGLGLIAGPSVGGLFYDPADKPLLAPLFPRGSYFDVHPYLLPCLIGATLSLIGLVVGLTSLEETLPASRRLSRTPAGKAAYTELSSTPAFTIGDDDDDDDDDEDQAADDNPRRPDQPEDFEEDQVAAARADYGVDISSTRAMLASPIVAKELATYALIAFVWIIFDELIPLWALNAVETGGLGLKSDKIGMYQGFSGLCLIACQILVFPRMIAAVGPRNTIRIGATGAVVLMASWPFITMFRTSPVALVIALGIGGFGRAIFGLFHFTSVFMIIGNSVPPAVLGKLNGMGQTLASAARSIGPPIGSTLFAWSLEEPRPFPLNIWAAFLFIAVAELVIFTIASSLPKSVDRRKTQTTLSSSSTLDVPDLVHPD